MLKKIDEQYLNSSKLNDLDILKDFFHLNEVAKLSESLRIKNYFQNYYNDLKAEVLRRNFIDLFPKINEYEENWKKEINVPKYKSITDSIIESTLSSKINKNISDYQVSIKNIGNNLSNDILVNINQSNVSQNEFVNQKTVYNAIALHIISQSNISKYNIIDQSPLASNEVLKSDKLKPEKTWRPKI